MMILPGSFADVQVTSVNGSKINAAAYMPNATHEHMLQRHACTLWQKGQPLAACTGDTHDEDV